MINSRKIEDLDPQVRPVCLRHIELCKDAGIELIVTSTYRDYQSQDQLYAIGRTSDLTRKPVTAAWAGHSWHNFRTAYDIVPIVAGKLVWNASDPLWKVVIRLGKQAGAEAGAAPTDARAPHGQAGPGCSLGHPAPLPQG